MIESCLSKSDTIWLHHVFFLIFLIFLFFLYRNLLYILISTTIAAGFTQIEKWPKNIYLVKNNQPMIYVWWRQRVEMLLFVTGNFVIKLIENSFREFLITFFFDRPITVLTYKKRITETLGCFCLLSSYKINCGFFYHRLHSIPKDNNNFFGKLKFLLHLGFPRPIWLA